MSSDREQILEKRRRLKKEYGELFDDVSSLLFRHDPIEINFETNKDEYDPEVGTILPRLHNCKTVADVQQVVYEEFIRWFGEDNTGSKNKYSKIAEEIWQLWKSRKLS